MPPSVVRFVRELRMGCVSSAGDSVPHEQRGVESGADFFLPRSLCLSPSLSKSPSFFLFIHLQSSFVSPGGKVAPGDTNVWTSLHLQLLVNCAFQICKHALQSFQSRPQFGVLRLHGAYLFVQVGILGLHGAYLLAKVSILGLQS